MHALRRSVGRIADLFLYAAAFATGLMMFHVAADVIAKRIVGAPLKGTLEMVSLYYMVAVVFLPLGVIQRDREHIFIELFTQGVGERTRRLLDAIGLLLMFVLSAILLWKGIEVAIEKMMVGEISQNMEFEIPVWQGRWFPVIGFCLTMIYALLYLVAELLAVVTGRAELPAKHSPDDHEGL